MEDSHLSFITTFQFRTPVEIEKKRKYLNQKERNEKQTGVQLTNNDPGHEPPETILRSNCRYI
jgi:hypothetical protein